MSAEPGCTIESLSSLYLSYVGSGPTGTLSRADRQHIPDLCGEAFIPHLYWGRHTAPPSMEIFTMHHSLTLSPLLTPRPSAAGRSKTVLAEQRLAVMKACDALLRSLEAALPEDCDHKPPTGAHGGMARKAWRERITLVEALRDEITMEAMKVTIDWNPGS